MRVLFVVRSLEAAEPMGLMQLAAVLRQRGHGVRLVGASTTPLIPLMETYRPGLVLTACSARSRKDVTPSPVTAGTGDAQRTPTVDASVGPLDAGNTIIADAAIGRPDARRVRREQPLPRNYVE
jgi:hypothetical protein